MTELTRYKLGKKPAVRPHGLASFSSYYLGRLPTPPPKVAPPDVSQWYMLGNDEYGDCVFAGMGHTIIASNAEVSEHDAVPDDAAVVKDYLDYNDGQDVGANEFDVLNRWREEGFFGGNKIVGFAPVNDNVNEVQTAISLYGVCFVGVALPMSAQQQFADGQPWSVVENDPIEGGHCIVFVGYDDKYLYAVTWGRIQAVTYQWWARYGDEAWAIITQAEKEKGGGPTVDLATLQHDLNALR